MVLRLRQSGLTQEDIARKIKTTRANVSLIEKRARENIDRSRETLKEWDSIVSPVRIVIKKGTDVIKIPEIVFGEADKSGIHVKANSLDLITRIKKDKGSVISNRTLEDDIEIDIAEAGEVSIL
jgi:HTH-type transcriptional regulator, fmd operon transcriptional regulator